MKNLIKSFAIFIVTIGLMASFVLPVAAEDGVKSIKVAKVTSGPRLCSEVKFGDVHGCFKLTNDNLTFGFLATHYAKRVGLTKKDFVALNGWELYLDQVIKPNVSYLYLLPQEALIASN